LILLSIVPFFRVLFSCFFDSSQFKAIRFIITIFGIAGIILGLLSWYTSKNPKAVTKETSFQFDISSPYLPAPPNEKTEETALNSALNDVIWNPFVMCFNQGWKPVLTETDYNLNAIVNFFSEDKGELITKQQIDTELTPGRSTANINKFYIPPKAIFNITRKEIEGRSWGYITIKNNYIELRLEITTFNKICFIKMIYQKKGFRNYILYDYDEYDRWFEILTKKILLKQEVIKKMNEHLRRQKK